MNKNKRNLAIFAPLPLLGIIIFTLPTWGVMVMNQIECPLNTSEEKNTIRESIIEGSSNFLLSNSYVYLLFSEYEKSENSQLNFEAALSYINKTIEKLEIARISYIYARDIGSRIGYNIDRLNLFLEFDYNLFIDKNNLNRDIAVLVKSYLEKGDIIGLHNKNIESLTKILFSLYEIKDEISKKIKPKKESMWLLLEGYSKAVLFGNIATQFGNAVLDSGDKCEG